MTKTNLITGFLGSGKTTTILHLLANKPENEKWAVLVNEFGEIGIDGALLSDRGALLKEIPGGCMCCVNGLPMQVGLNTLLRQYKPDRLLIEPTGLGHPRQILTMLTAPVYEPWITLQASFCLLDPRQLADEKVRGNENFRDQLAAADIIVANKQDRSDATAQAALDAWWAEQSNGRLLVHCSQGEIEPTLVDTPGPTIPCPRKVQHTATSMPPLRLGWPHYLCLTINAGAVCLTRARGIRPAGGFSMPTQSLIPPEFSSGPALHRWSG